MTPSRCSPGTFMKRGRPAPVPTKIFQNPASLRSSSVAVLPTTKFVHEPAAEQLDLADHVVDQLVGQAELGNAVAQHAAEFVERLEHRDREALGRQQIGVDEAGRAGADHRDRRLLGLRPRVDAAPSSRSADGSGSTSFSRCGRNHSSWPISIGRSVMRAHALALQFLRADAAGDVGQRIAALDQFERLAEPARARAGPASRGCGS